MPQQKPRATDKRVARARTLRRDATDAEHLLWQHLRQPPFKEHHIRRQATIGAFFCDFASHKLRLVVELDGGQHATTPLTNGERHFLQARGIACCDSGTMT
jgi:very-short-patch-repair endonuclease